MNVKLTGLQINIKDILLRFNNINGHSIYHQRLFGHNFYLFLNIHIRDVRLFLMRLIPVYDVAERCLFPNVFSAWKLVTEFCGLVQCRALEATGGISGLL